MIAVATVATTVAVALMMVVTVRPRLVLISGSNDLSVEMRYVR